MGNLKRLGEGILETPNSEDLHLSKWHLGTCRFFHYRGYRRIGFSEGI